MKLNEKGYTLMEMMMTLVVSSVLFYGLANSMQVGTQQLDTAGLRMDIQESAREGLYRMIQEIRQSAPTRITIGQGGATLQIRVPDPANPVLADFTPNWAGSRNITYALGGNGNQIIRTDVTSGQTRVVANDVTSVTFTGNMANPTLVTVTVRVQRALPNGNLVPVTPMQLSGQAEVRNA